MVVPFLASAWVHIIWVPKRLPKIPPLLLHSLAEVLVEQSGLAGNLHLSFVTGFFFDGVPHGEGWIVGLWLLEGGGGGGWGYLFGPFRPLCKLCSLWASPRGGGTPPCGSLLHLLQMPRHVLACMCKINC